MRHSQRGAHALMLLVYQRSCRKDLFFSHLRPYCGAGDPGAADRADLERAVVSSTNGPLSGLKAGCWCEQVVWRYASMPPRQLISQELKDQPECRSPGALGATSLRRLCAPAQSRDDQTRPARRCELR